MTAMRRQFVGSLLALDAICAMRALDREPNVSGNNLAARIQNRLATRWTESSGYNSRESCIKDVGLMLEVWWVTLRSVPVRLRLERSIGGRDEHLCHNVREAKRMYSVRTGVPCEETFDNASIAIDAAKPTGNGLSGSTSRRPRTHNWYSLPLRPVHPFSNSECTDGLGSGRLSPIRVLANGGRDGTGRAIRTIGAIRSIGTFGTVRILGVSSYEVLFAQYSRVII